MTGIHGGIILCALRSKPAPHPIETARLAKAHLGLPAFAYPPALLGARFNPSSACRDRPEWHVACADASARAPPPRDATEAVYAMRAPWARELEGFLDAQHALYRPWFDGTAAASEPFLWPLETDGGPG